MPIITEDTDLPGRQAPLIEVRVELADSNCNPFSPGFTVLPEPLTTIIGAKRLKPGHGIGDNGFWSLDLVSNLHIEPSGTTYLITRKTSDGDVSTSCVSVPVSGGPFSVTDVLVSAPGALPMAPPSNELDAAEITSNINGIGPFNGFNLVPIPGLVVSVPDVARPCWIMTQLWMEHSAPDVSLAAAIAPVGSIAITQQIAMAPGFVGAAGKETGPLAWARLGPNQPGTFQAFAYADSVGTANVIASVTNPLRIAVLGV